MIFPTLSFQLAYRYPPFRKELLQVLKATPDVGRESLCSQMEKLIVGPLRATSIPTLIIIDALDECKDEEPASAILSVLSRCMPISPLSSSSSLDDPRPGFALDSALKSLLPITEVLKLHEVKPEVVDNDIKLFFQSQLSDLTENRSDCDSTEDWPSPSDVEICARRQLDSSSTPQLSSSLLPLMAYQLIGLPSSPPFQKAPCKEGRSGVDQLYTKVLQQAFINVHPRQHQPYLQFQSVVGAVLLIFNPLSIKGLSDLLGPSTHISEIPSAPSIPSSLSQRAQKIPSASSTNHSLTSSWTHIAVKTRRFFIEPAGHHVEILLACLRLMGERLKRNICNLDDYAILSEVKDLSVHKKPTLEMLWNMHAGSGPSTSWGPPAKPLILRKCRMAIDKFFTVHLLHWIEVLAITGNLGSGVYSMNDIEKWYSLVSVMQFVCQILF
jgi:hypothetical protein